MDEEAVEEEEEEGQEEGGKREEEERTWIVSATASTPLPLLPRLETTTRGDEAL